jgi:hypothetical protein
MALVAEFDVAPLQDAAPLYINQVFVIDEDIGDGGVLQQRLEWAEPEDFIEKLRLNLVFLGCIQWHLLLRHDFHHQVRDRLPGFSVIHGRQFLQVHFRDQRTVNVGLQLFEIQVIHRLYYLSSDQNS